MKRISLGGIQITDLEKKYVMETLDRNFISPGPLVEEIENKISRMHSYDYGITTNSGQTAIEIALRVLGEHYKLYNRESPPVVAVPACTYISTLAAAVFAGFILKLVDVDLDHNMSPQSLKDLLKTTKVDVVVPVHLYGKACKPEIKKLCQEYGLYTVGDACESTFAPGIGWENILTTSFYSNHLISGGQGGMMMTNNPDIAFKSWAYTNHGRDFKYNNDDIHRISEKFKFSTWGHSAKLNDVTAAIIKAQVERWPEMLSKRRSNALYLLNRLQGFPAILPDPIDHIFMMFPIILNQDINRNKVVKYLNDNLIETRMAMPITNQKVVIDYFDQFGWQDTPNANFINQQGFYVGTHPALNINDMEFIAKILWEAVQCKQPNNL